MGAADTRHVVGPGRRRALTPRPGGDGGAAICSRGSGGGCRRCGQCGVVAGEVAPSAFSATARRDARSAGLPSAGPGRLRADRSSPHRGGAGNGLFAQIGGGVKKRHRPWAQAVLTASSHVLCAAAFGRRPCPRRAPLGVVSGRCLRCRWVRRVGTAVGRRRTHHGRVVPRGCDALPAWSSAPHGQAEQLLGRSLSVFRALNECPPCACTAASTLPTLWPSPAARLQ